MQSKIMRALVFLTTLYSDALAITSRAFIRKIRMGCVPSVKVPLLPDDQWPLEDDANQRGQGHKNFSDAEWPSDDELDWDSEYGELSLYDEKPFESDDDTVSASGFGD